MDRSAPAGAHEPPCILFTRARRGKATKRLLDQAGSQKAGRAAPGVKIGRDFDHVEALFLAQRERLVEAQLAIFLAVITDQKNRLSDDLVIDTRTTLDGGLLVLLKTPGDYDSLLVW